MVESWIDALTKVWQFSTGRNKTVKSFRLFEKSELPEVLSPESFPVALSFVSSVDIEYSRGGPCFGVWRGTTEFHITKNLSKGDIPLVMTFYGKIWQAAAANFTLGGRVAYFVLSTDNNAIMGPVSLKYSEEAEHWGLLVNWVVKEHVESQLTFGNGS